jgi:outer membrane lipoprotein-sorting protein
MLLLVILGLALTGALPSAGKAYVLHGYHLVEMLSAALGEARGLEVEQNLILPDGSGNEGEIEIRETVLYRFPGAYRSQSQTGGSERIHVVSQGRAVTVVDGFITAETEAETDLYKDVLLYHSPESLKYQLRNLGLAPEISSLGRYQGRVGFVLGAQYPDETAPQLWIDRETFRPFRWVIRPRSPQGAGEVLEVRFYGWRKIESIWYPMRIEYYQGDTLLRTIQVERIRINPPISDTMLDIERIRAAYPRSTPPVPETSGTESKSEVQKTIDRFRKLFE